MGSESDSRFAHLLQPIRDLADNWNIDIARELEDYLGELEKITFSFDGVSNSLNFAQAALVIQGSAVVYSKKVEYLYALLYQTLDFLAEKKQKKAQSDATDKDSNEVPEEPDFLSLDDDDLQEGNGIDLVEGEGPTRARHSHIGLSMPFPIISEPVHTDESTPTNAPRNSGFTINSCYVHSSGAYVLDAAFIGDDLRSTFSTPYTTPRTSIQPQQDESNTLLNTTLNKSILNTTNPLSTTQEPQSIADITTGGAGASIGGLELGGTMSDDDSDNEEERPSSIFGQFAAATSQVAEKSGEAPNGKAMTKKVVRGKRDRPQKRIADLWATLDPHEEVGAIKPFKKGKPFRIRSSPKPKPEEAEAEAVVPILSIAETPFIFRGVRGPDFQEFAYLFSAELKRRKDAKKRDKLEFSFEETVYAVAEEEEEEERLDFSRPEMSVHFNGAVEPEVAEENAGFEGANDEDDDDVDIGDAGILDQDQDEAETQSYEDFYAQRVEQFISETAAYAQETNLSKRVNDWKSKLAPFLEEQESHPNFDMQEYGDTLIHTLKDEYDGKPGVKINKEGDVTADDDLIIPFAKLTVGVERYEVARRFAAVLQLINNENVAVVTSKEVDSLSFQLLSIKPKYDIENYLAPSLNPTPSSQSSASSSSGAKKARADDREDKDKGSQKGKRGRKDEDKEDGPTKKRAGKSKKGTDDSENEKTITTTTRGKKAATTQDDKENHSNSETSGRGKRKTRAAATSHNSSDDELRGPKTKMFAEKELLTA